MERGYFRWNFAGEIIARQVDELEVEALSDRSEAAVEAVITEVEEAELVYGGEGINWATKVEGWEGEGSDTVVNALYTNPIGSACGGAVGGCGPVGEEDAMMVGLRAEEEESGGIIGGGGGGGMGECSTEEEKGQKIDIHFSRE